MAWFIRRLVKWLRRRHPNIYVRVWCAEGWLEAHHPGLYWRVMRLLSLPPRCALCGSRDWQATLCLLRVRRFNFFGPAHFGCADALERGWIIPW